MRTDQIEIWNLTDGGMARCGCVDIFNVVGRVEDPARIEKFVYRLNDGPEIPVYFARKPAPGSRLSRPGDFNIDTIALADLAPENRLSLRIKRAGHAEHRREIGFRSAPFEQVHPSFRLDLSAASTAEQVGQIVEGPWRINEDERGQRSLEIAPEDAGYDRIILFGREDWTTGYEVRARLAVTRIIGPHNVGLVFKWNPHERGAGNRLPKKWSSGLGYYCSYGEHPGVRIRYVVPAHWDEAGQRRGEHLLARRPLATTPWQAFLGKLKRRARLSRPASELRQMQDYSFRMLVHPKRLALSVWPSERVEPPAQLVVDDPIDPLPQGAVGILAYHVGVRLYEFEVRRISDSLD